MKDTHKPGTNVGNQGGIYREVGPRGGEKQNFATVPDNKSLPPTTKPGHEWLLIEKTPNSRR